MSGTQYDVIVIGAGPGGYVCAIRAAQNGLKVAVVDRDERPGGTCLLRGCIPTKALLESASLYDKAKEAAEFGVLTDGVRYDWSLVNKRKEKVIAKNTNGVKFLFRKNGVEHVVGTASLAGPGVVEVTKADGSKTKLTAKHVVLATGSAVRHIPIAKPDGKRIFSSDELLDIDHVPASLIVVGAGAVGVEFASVHARFGAKVTIVEMMPRLLPIEDEEVSAEFEKIYRRRGITALTNTALQKVDVLADGVEITYETKGKAPEKLKAEALLVATGRRPVTENLGLEKFKGVQLDRGYVKVDGHLRTGEAWLSAIGDIITTGPRPHPQLAHIASAEGVLVADRLAGRHVAPIDYERGTISATYSDPEVASVGLTEAQAREKYGKVRVGKFPYQAIGKAAVTGHNEGFIKVVAAEKYDELLGVHIIGDKATELIHEAAVALKLEATSEEIAHTIHAHPTLAEGIGEAFHAVLGKATGA
ncbi:MAG: dihydrolipoyl dehydrogenase [Pseudomonadota bacterium]|jgi:dihydrolipoamide dehydrogenase